MKASLIKSLVSTIKGTIQLAGIYLVLLGIASLFVHGHPVYGSLGAFLTLWAFIYSIQN
jgi:hypothetical protein